MLLVVMIGLYIESGAAITMVIINAVFALAYYIAAKRISKAPSTI